NWGASQLDCSHGCYWRKGLYGSRLHCVGPVALWNWCSQLGHGRNTCKALIYKIRNEGVTEHVFGQHKSSTCLSRSGARSKVGCRSEERVRRKSVSSTRPLSAHSGRTKSY